LFSAILLEVFMGEVAPSADANVPVARSRTGSYARYVFLIMFTINLLNYMDRYVLTGAADTVAHELHLTLADLGYIASAFLVVYTLCTLPFGIWADRTKRKNVVAVCVTIWSVATAFTALAGNFSSLFLSRMVLGVGEAGYYPAGTALMSDYFHREQRARVMSRWSAGSLVGLMIGFIVGGVVAGLGYGMWRVAFLFTGIPGLLLAYLCWRLREPRRNEADEEALALNPEAYAVSVPESNPGEAEAVAFHESPRRLTLGGHVRQILREMGTLLRIKTLVVLIVIQAFAFFAQGASVFFLPVYLQQHDTLGLSSGLAATLAGVVVVVGGIAGLIVGGYMADVLNRRHPGARVLVCGIGFLLCAPVFALTVTIHSFAVFVICFFITVMLINLYNGPSTAATQDVVPAVLRASAVAISLLAAHLFGDAFATSIVGSLASAFDPTHGAHFTNHMAGGDLSLALLVTCVPALVIAGLVGIFGARWMKADLAAAQQADHLARVGSMAKDAPTSSAGA
jgi:MFS family permease